MKITRTGFCIIALVTSMTACSRQELHAPAPPAVVTTAAIPIPQKAAPAPAPGSARSREQMHEDELMRAIFHEAYLPGQGFALADITDEKGEKGKYIVTVLSTTLLPDGRTVVAANAAQSDDEGNEQAGHASPGLLNVYFLKREGGEWKVLERRENVTATGSSGNVGNVTWVTLAPGKPGFILSSGGVWQGYVISVAEVFDLADGIRSLGGFKERSDNGGACTPETDECWEVGGTLRFVDNDGTSPYRDILVDFSGRKYTLTTGKDGKDIEHLKASIGQTARYRFDGKQYQLISGANPVPDV